jgi:hypothetical protein
MTEQPPDAIPPPPEQPPPLGMPPSQPARLTYYHEPELPRPRRNVVWYLAIGVAIVVTLGALGLLYLDDQSWQRQAADLHRQNQSLNDQLSTTKSDEATAQQHVKDLQTQLQHPDLGIWNVPQQIDGPNAWLEGGIPDTFTYHLKATSTGPMAVMIMTFDQYAAAYDCANAGHSTSYQCFTGAPSIKSWIGVTSISYDFHQAEGCAGYLAVWTAPTTITVQPDVSVTYNPAQTFTGVC